MDPTPVSLPRHPTGAGVWIALNPASGTAVVRLDPARALRERLPDAAFHELAPDESLEDAVGGALSADPRPEVLGVIGGDGTVARMAHLARRHDLPLLVVPGGTFNHFARTAGLVDVEAVTKALAQGSGRAVTVMDVAADDRPAITVLNAVSVGVYPELIVQREHRRRLGKWLGSVAATWEELRRAEPLTIVREGRRARVWSAFVGVGRNDPRRVAMMQRLTLGDRTLDARIHHARGTRARAVASLAFGHRTAAVLRALRLMPPDSDVQRLVTDEIVLEVRMPADRPAAYVHDGELVEPPASPFTLRCRTAPGELRIYAP